MRIKVGVIFGGETVEHEVSIISAIQAMNKIDEKKYEVIPIYITKDREWYTGDMLKDIEVYQDFSLIKKYSDNVVLYYKDGSYVLQKKHGLFKSVVKELDIAFPIVHGTNVEDGVLQGYLQTIGIPYVGPNVYAAVVGQDKAFMKDVWASANLPIKNYVWFYDYEYEKNKKEVLERIATLNYPLYVKPSSLGSSIGINLVKDEKDLTKAIKEAMQFDRKILVEEQVKNVKEANISVLGTVEKQSVSEIEEINTNEEFYSFKEKYVEGYRKICKKNEKCKPLISKEMMEDMKNYAMKTFKVIGASGVARIDFLIDDKNKKIFVNEINTIPGDLSSYLWIAKKVSQPELIENLIKIAVAEQKKKDSKIYAFPGNLLEEYDILKGEKLTKNKR